MKDFFPMHRWTGERGFLNDGKYNAPNNYVAGVEYGKENPPYFPGYIENENHPFMFCNSLTHPDPQDSTKLSFNFSGSDGPKEFEKNKIKKGPDWKYLTKEITYNVNSSGYRTHEWKDINWKDAILLFGCSCTYGIGVAEDETMSYYLEKLTGRQVVNLGYPGGSNSVIATLCAIALEKYGNPYAVVANWTTGDRYRHYFKDQYREVGPWDHSSVTKNEFDRTVQNIDLSTAWESRYLDRYNELAENYYISKIVKTLCRGSKYVSMSYFGYMAHINRADFYVPFRLEARDLLHPSAEDHEISAKKIVELL